MYLFFIWIGSSVSKNIVSTTASITSPSGKWDVADDIDSQNYNKIIKRKLDFGSTLLDSTSPQTDADIHHNSIIVDYSLIHYSK